MSQAISRIAECDYRLGVPDEDEEDVMGQNLHDESRVPRSHLPDLNQAYSQLFY